MKLRVAVLLLSAMMAVSACGTRNGRTVELPGGVTPDEQFVEFKAMLRSAMQEDWEWQLHSLDERGRTISRIFKQAEDLSIFNKNDWPELISFFKPRIIALDEFWSDAKYAFDTLK